MQAQLQVQAWADQLGASCLPTFVALWNQCETGTGNGEQGRAYLGKDERSRGSLDDPRTHPGEGRSSSCVGDRAMESKRSRPAPPGGARRLTMESACCPLSVPGAVPEGAGLGLGLGPGMQPVNDSPGA